MSTLEAFTLDPDARPCLVEGSHAAVDAMLAAGLRAAIELGETHDAGLPEYPLWVRGRVVGYPILGEWGDRDTVSAERTCEWYRGRYRMEGELYCTFSATVVLAQRMEDDEAPAYDVLVHLQLVAYNLGDVRCMSHDDVDVDAIEEAIR